MMRIKRFTLLEGLAFFLMFGAAVAFIYLYLQTRDLATQNHKLALNNRRLALQGKQAHDVLCGRRVRIGKEIKTSLDFLKRHPKGIPSLGLTAKLIRDGIADSRAELKTFKPLKCPRPASRARRT